MKRARYTLSVEYNNGESLHQAPLTQERAYQILRAYKDKSWIVRGFKISDIEPLRIIRWKIETRWQETSE